MSAEVTARDFPGIGWRGHWVWAVPPPQMRFEPGSETIGNGKAPEARGLFRKTFTLETAPARVPARITADSRYLLFVNGQEVARGPIRSQPRRLHYDLCDLAPYLKAGENTLAVLVVYYGTPRSFWMPAPPAMGPLGKSGVLVFEADLGIAGGWLVSDESWRTVKCDAWTEDWKGQGVGGFLGDAIPTEVVDARRLPFGWEQPGFDDGGWDHAHIIAAGGFGAPQRSQPPMGPYGPMYPRPIAALGGEVCSPVVVAAEYLGGPIPVAFGDPVKRLQESLNLPQSGPAAGDRLPLSLDIPTGGCARVTLDMGRIVMGQVGFAVDAPAGTVFDFSYTEEPLAPPRRGYGGMRLGTRYVARGENDRFQVFDALGFRYAYVLVHGGAGPVTLMRFAVQEDVYPWQAGATFRCSDATLNRIYSAGIRTVQLNSRDSFTDCPTREQRAWVGDSVVHQMVHLATNTDWRLAWHYLTLADSPRPDGILPMSVVGEIESSGSQTIPDWSLHWVHGVYNLYRFSGDRAAVKAHMPSIERVLRWYLPFQNADGQLQHLVEWNLVDWSALSVEDTTSVITALWARGLAEFAEMAGWLGESASREWAEAVYARAKAGFEMFWDADRGSYIDHIVDGERRPEMSQLAGALAIVSGLAPQERWPRIIAAITDPDKVVIRTWIGIAEEGDASAGFGGPRRFTWDVEREIVRAEPFMSYVVHDAVVAAGQADRLPVIYQDWAKFLTGGYDTIGEDWRHGTHVHGWSCTPTRDMVFYTLGVTPAEPGYAVARIAPRLGGLQWAEGQAPTPHGLISVRAEPGKVVVDSPIPVIVDLPGQAPVSLPAGRREVTA